MDRRSLLIGTLLSGGGGSAPAVLRSLSVITNGTYTATECDGYNEVVVNVQPKLNGEQFTANGVYFPQAPYDGWGKVTVAVPQVVPNLDSLSVTTNGTYTPPTGVVGYNSVTVNVAGGLDAVNLTGDISNMCSGPFAAPYIANNLALINSFNDITSAQYAFRVDEEAFGYAVTNKIINLTDADCSHMFQDYNKNASTGGYVPTLSGTTNDIEYMFHYSGHLKDVDLSNLEVYDATSSASFYMSDIESLVFFKRLGCQSIHNMFKQAYYLNNIDASESTIEHDVPDGWGGGNHSGMFSDCYSLREIPEEFNSVFAWNYDGNSASCSPYYEAFNNCYALNKINGLAVNSAPAAINMFSYTFKNCRMLKSFTFEEDKTVTWHNQVIDLTNAGYCASDDDVDKLMNYNAGLSYGCEVNNAATYEALKDTTDWWTMNHWYSRYNHDSAVETISSLPTNTASGGTNTIKFRGEAGYSTDGGAISTLTDAEIAVAAAKGWTVTLS